ncbi:hypothetical protein P8452_72434 [Trifolium repens]|nr:hypothetical protein P8452_72434 [Trifolium repens]
MPELEEHLKWLYPPTNSLVKSGHDDLTLDLGQYEHQERQIKPELVSFLGAVVAPLCFEFYDLAFWLTQIQSLVLKD